MPAGSTDTLTRKTTIGTSWVAASAISRQLLSFISVAVLARFVDPSAYGLISMAGLLINFLQNFRDLGTGSAVIQRATVSEGLLASVFWVNTAVGALLTALIWILAPLAAAFFREPTLAPVLHALAFTFLLASLAVLPNALLNRRMSFRPVAVAEVASAVTGTVVAIVMAARGAGVWSLVAGSLTTAAAYLALIWFACAWWPRSAGSWREVRSIAAYSLNLFGFTLVNYGARNADNLIVGKFLGSTALGQYNMAYTLMLYPVQNVSQVVAQAVFPAFSKIQDERDRFAAAYLRVSTTIALLTFPMMAGLTVVADPFVRTVLGPQWLPVIPLLQILAPVGLMQSMMTLTGQIYTAIGRTDLMFRFGMLFCSVFILSFFAGLPWGTTGVAAAYALANLLLVYPVFAIPFRLVSLTVPTFLRTLAPQLGLAIAMALVVKAALLGLLRWGVESPLVLLCASVALGMAVYIAGALAFRLPALDAVAAILRQTGRTPLLRLASFLALRERA